MRSGLIAFGAACTLWLAAIEADARQDGVIMLVGGTYTVEQAARGKAHYQAFCASCHVADLSGTLAADTGAPPLRGAAFVASLQRKGAASIFDYVKTTMPADDPASLQERWYVDILAYVFQANGFPAGPRELSAADLPQVRVGRFATP